jgi:hypothetical protein
VNFLWLLFLFHCFIIWCNSLTGGLRHHFVFEKNNWFENFKCYSSQISADVQELDRRTANCEDEMLASKYDTVRKSSEVSKITGLCNMTG